MILLLVYFLTFLTGCFVIIYLLLFLQLTSLVSGLMAKLWCQKPDPTFLLILSSVGPLVSFEGLLSYYGDEIDMWGDMAIAVEDLRTVTFTITRCPPDTRYYS